LHLLCHGFNYEADAMKTMVNRISKLRRERIIAIFDHLRIKHKVLIPEEEKEIILNRTTPGKVHIADAAMRIGHPMSRQEFFDNCLNDMESREFKLNAIDVIDAANAAGGVVSLAHPIEVQKKYSLDFNDLSKMVKRLRDVGLTGIEVYNSVHGRVEISEYKKIAAQYDLLIAGGSDYHGGNKDVTIGQLSNYGFVPEEKDLTLYDLFAES